MPLADASIPRSDAACDEQSGRAAPLGVGWGLWLGVLSLVGGPVLGALAIILGRSALAAPGQRAKAVLTMALGSLSVVGFCALALLYARASPYTERPRSSRVAAGEPRPSAAALDTAVARVGQITVVDIAGRPTLREQLRGQVQLAQAAGERVLLQTLTSSCAPCEGVAEALPDHRMQDALQGFRLVRVDLEEYEDELEELSVPTEPYPGFFLLDHELKISDAINGGEWDEDVARNIAPVLASFLKGTYTSRRTPWRKSTRPSSTVL